MVTMLLAECGLYLGREQKLMPATVDNPSGYFENLQMVALNDALLGKMGGTWDRPPSGTLDFAALRADPILGWRIRRALRQFRHAPWWGWKDPRTSITAPFWVGAVPDLKFVICLRHPSAVAASLSRRHHTPRPNGLELWEIYNRHLLSNVPRERRLIVSFQAVLADPVKALKRILDFAGSDTFVKRDLYEAVRGVFTDELQQDHLVPDRSNPDLANLYDRLLREAGQ